MISHQPASPHRAWLLCIGIAGLLSLTSCGEQTIEPSHTILNAPSESAITTGSISGLQRNGIFIQLPAGLPDELASQLLARFQEASIANQLTLARTGTVPELTIKGVARAGIARDGTAVALVWEVLGPQGDRIKLISNDVLIERMHTSVLPTYEPWSAVDEATLEKIADAAALELASWYSDRALGAAPDAEIAFATASIDDLDAPTSTSEAKPIDFTTPSILQRGEAIAYAQTEPATGITARNSTLGFPSHSQPQQPSPAVANPTVSSQSIAPYDRELEQFTALPDPVHAPPHQTSATRALFDVAIGTSPGDGRLSLAAAVQEALVEAQYKIETPLAFRVIGNVLLETSKPGTANVSIEWTVTTKDGVPLGLISQSNEVEADAVAGAWGEIATAAGTAAATGILELINEPTPPA